MRAACALCVELGTAAVCVKPSMVALASELLDGTPVVASTVIGFPHGGSSTATKVYETELALKEGAREVDMVVNLGWVFAQDWLQVADDIQAFVAAARNGKAIAKIIFETGLLRDVAAKIRLCELSEAAGADFVKTSTGFGYVSDADGALRSTGATEPDVVLLRASCGSKVQVKASGGIRTRADAERFVALGATRLGTSATRAIADDAGDHASDNY